MTESDLPGAADWRLEKRTAIDDVFLTAEPQGAISNESPSGRYNLEVTSLSSSTRWGYTEGIVRSDRSRQVIASVRRNYGQFPFAWCEDHPNGHDYLICGEDYQGQTIVELDTAHRVDHLAAQAEQGFGFCWAQHYIVPSKNILIVDGCYWACPYELVAFDFSTPLELPYVELHRWSGDIAEVAGFDADGTLTWTFGRDVRLPDGKPHDDLSDAEEAELLDGDGKYLSGVLGTQNYQARWTADQPFESTTVEPIPSELTGWE